MSDVNEFDASTSTAALRAFTTQEAADKAAFDAIPKTPTVAASAPDETLSYLPSVSATTYTLAASNISKLTEFTSNSAVTITIPNDASDTTFPIGSTIEVRQMGTGRITFSYSSPVTLASTDGYVKTRTQYSSAMLEKRASNSWLLTGDIDA